MDLIQYHKMREGVQVNAFPGSAEELAALTDQLQRNLLSSGLFEEVEVGCTDDIDHLVIAMCTFPAHLTEAQVASRLERLWEDRLRYGFWEAHATLVDEDHVEFQGATRAGSNAHYATMHIVAQKATVPAQRVAAE